RLDSARLGRPHDRRLVPVRWHRTCPMAGRRAARRPTLRSGLHRHPRRKRRPRHRTPMQLLGHHHRIDTTILLVATQAAARSSMSRRRLHRPNGVVELLDQNEFAAHRRQYGYPPHVVRQATETADWLLSAIKGRVEPFGNAYEHWLDNV